jgi:deoxyribonuclease IV
VKIGFHLPISQGFEHTRKEAARLGCEVVQIFVKNPRSWIEKTWKDKDRETFRALFHNLPVVAHLSYLPNIAKCDLDPKNRLGLFHEAGLCTGLGINTMVVHCGSRDDRKKGLEVVAQTINDLLAQFPLTLLVENSAGQGNALGRDIEELLSIHEMIGDRRRAGFCLDTAHLFESGYDVRKRTVWRDIMSRIDGRCGTDAVRFFHLNDSKTTLGSRVDRHWHIGRGEIGRGCFRYLLREKQLAHLGGVMETPKMGNMDEENMSAMRSLLSPLVSGPFS